MSKNKPTKLLWADLEMTGLDPEEDRILEVAIIVTDFDFNEIETYESVVFQDEALVEERMKQSPWYENTYGERKKVGTVYDMAKASGLLEKIAKGKPEEKVIEEVSALIKRNFEHEAILAGNSIHQDRRFIRKWWPSVDEMLHYRMLDVTSFKIFMQGKYGQEFKKNNEHKALEDIRGSIQELQYYINKLPKYLNGSE
jgi:oligoribonuclease